MEEFFMRSWWATAMRGLIGIVFGVLAIAWPGLSLLTLVVLFAAYALLAGVAAVAGAIRHGRSGDDWWGALLLGLVSIGAGIIAAVNPGLTALVLILVMGANALVTGVIDILAAIRLRKAIEDEWLLGLSGLVSVVFGAFVFFYPGAGALAVVWLISLYAMISGALLLALALRMRILTRAGGLPARMERRVLHDRRMPGT
jgi:uncharacterized membrane protein HdeD (DUF308 family)